MGEMTLHELAEACEDIDGQDNGCCLHIAMTDYNLRDEDIQWCIDFAKTCYYVDSRGIPHDGCDRCVEVGEALLKVPEDHRESFLGVRLEPDGNGFHRSGRELKNAFCR